MPSTYTLNNGIELIGTGEQSGTWGDTTNTNLELLDTALDGQVTVTLSSTGSGGSPNTLPISDGSSSNGRNRLVVFNDGSDIGGTVYVQLTPNDAEKIIYVRNSLSGSRSILLFQGTYSASNDYEIPAGTTAIVFFNGGGTGAVAANVFNNAYFDGLRLGDVSVTAIIDDDTMGTASATNIATSESIKAYVDSQVTAQDLDFGGDSGTGAVDLDSQTFTVAGTSNEIETSASGQTLTIGLPDDVTIAGDLTVDTDTLYVDSTNDRVGINDASPSYTLDLKRTDAAGGYAYLGASSDGGSRGLIFTSSDNGIYLGAVHEIDASSSGGQIALSTGNSEAIRIDSSQRVLIGMTAAQTTASVTGLLEIAGTTAGDSSITPMRFSANNGGTSIRFLKSRSSTITGSRAIVQDDDTIATINFAVDDGTDLNSQSAYIGAFVDGTPGENDTPGRLIFATASDGNGYATERMRIDSSGVVLIGIQSTTLTNVGISLPNDGIIAFNDAGGAARNILQFASGVIKHGAAGAGVDTQTFHTSNIEAMRIDSSQRVLIGANSNQEVLLSSGNQVQIQGLNSNQSAISITRHTNDGGGPYVNFGKTRGTADGAVTVVQNADVLGQVFWSGADGTDIKSPAAAIQGIVDGTPGSNDMPGRLSFMTTADGTNTVTERMRITSAGIVELYGNSSSTLYLKSSSPILAFTDTNSFPDANDRFQIRGTSSDGIAAGSMGFYNDSNDTTYTYFTLRDDGKIGIRNTTPTAIGLQIGGDPSGTVAPSMSISLADGGGTNTSLAIRGGSPTIFFDQTGGGNAKFLMDSADIAFKSGSLQSEGNEIMRLEDGGTLKIGSASGTGVLSVTNTGSTDGNNIASFQGTDVNQRLIVQNYKCGSAEDRVGLMFENQGIANMRIWMGDDQKLYSKGSNPTDDTDGNYFVQVNGSGNIAMPNGKGIDFSATSNGSGTTTSELFDDYEEGTWTPVYSTSGGGQSVSYTNQYGIYTKIGNLVTIHLNLDIASATNVGSGDIVITGLPFASGSTSSSTNYNRTTFSTYNVDYDSTDGTQMHMYIPTTNVSKLQILYSRDNSSWFVGTTSNFNIGTNRTIIVMGSLSYYTDA